MRHRYYIDSIDPDIGVNRELLSHKVQNHSSRSGRRSSHDNFAGGAIID